MRNKAPNWLGSHGTLPNVSSVALYVDAKGCMMKNTLTRTTMSDSTSTVWYSQSPLLHVGTAGTPAQLSLCGAWARGAATAALVKWQVAVVHQDGAETEEEDQRVALKRLQRHACGVGVLQPGKRGRVSAARCARTVQAAPHRQQIAAWRP